MKMAFEFGGSCSKGEDDVLWVSGCPIRIFGEGVDQHLNQCPLILSARESAFQKELIEGTYH